ncbi:hypothetical protein STCU_09003 [Strigomonas culicis]|uniref:Uncharacterized protein n=1 Tax=Strigomonas culicis TaxID=28005 RepID=S9TV24_9TRYP|nr:hypothetical protein STCU_09003 [Strigomonas culicis]|eukprot:EPY20414.1 hypothetical protein STCU_09003 [Strigomonas culicis]
MADTCSSGSAASFTDDGLALTVLLNRPDVLQRLVVPLLAEELAAAHSRAASAARQCDVLCALIGLGALAKAALPLLLDCLRRGEGDARLVALAVRTSGGADGIEALCRLAQEQPAAPAAQQAAAWGLGALPVDTAGHTSVVCVGGLAHALGFCPAGTDGEAARADDAEADVVTLQGAAPYVPTNLLLHSDEARRAMLAFVSAAPFPPMRQYPHLPTVLRDVASAATAAAVAAQLAGEPLRAVWAKAHAQLRDELAPLLDGAAAGGVLPHAYSSSFRDHRELLFRVEQCLVTAAAEATDAATREQALLSLASLPAFAREHCAPAVQDILTLGLQAFERRWAGAGADGGGAPQDADEAVLVAAEVALGVVCTRQACDAAAVEACAALLSRLLTSPRWRLRHGACVGLGHLAPRRARTEDTVAELVRRLADTSVSPDTVVWALVRQGPCGLRKLLDVLRLPTLPVAAHVACARGLAQVETAVRHCADAPAERHRLHQELAESVGELILSAGPLPEEVLLESVQALAKGLGGRRFGGDAEAVRHYEAETPSPCYLVLRALVEATVLPYAVVRALFVALCRGGGAHGEAYTCHKAMEGERLAARAAAAFALRVCGGRVIRTVAVTINDPAVEVRREGIGTLEELGVEEVVRVLQRRPPAHRQQVTAALRDALLRDVGRGRRHHVVQQLYDTLTTMP